MKNNKAIDTVLANASQIDIPSVSWNSKNDPLCRKSIVIIRLLRIYDTTDVGTTEQLSHYLQHLLWLRVLADYGFAPNQQETLLQCNAVSHWLGANLESAL